MKDWFWARAMATDGNLTVEQYTLNKVAEHIAYDYIHYNITPDYSQAIKYCNLADCNYDSLLEEEKDYLDKQVENLIKTSW